jgi:hypothetical protein
MRSVRWVWLGALLMLGGCNTVHSTKPLFGPEDAVAGPPFKPGLWSMRMFGGGEPDPCNFNVDKPVRLWPACAPWGLVRETDILDYDRKDKTWSAKAYVLTDGRPRILQTIDLPTAEDRQASVGEDGVTTDYDGVAPTVVDATGRISAFRRWSAQCGPPDHTEYPENSGPHPTTLAPLSGLAMDEDGQSCAAKDQDAVRRSVVASETWSSDATEYYWVRDVRPDDFAQ